MARRDLTGAVDFGYLETFTAGDAQVIEEVLGLFREQAELWLRLLDPAAEAEAWRDAAHTLKGAALGIGAEDLAEACKTAEFDTSSDAGRRAHLLDKVRDALDLALADIAAYQHEAALTGLKTPR
jgi:HPt (histidine-containing phosphotransfer) domain-containing protein